MEDSDTHPEIVPSKRPRLSEAAEPSIGLGEREMQASTSAILPEDAGESSAQTADGSHEVDKQDDMHDNETVSSSREKGKGKDQGFVPIHGNYRGYYGKRRLGQDPYSGDERLALIPREWLEDQRVLDVGCNAGGVTIEIAQKYRPYRITGVDIDPELIRTAHKRARIAWSSQEPLPNVNKAASAERGRDPRQTWRYASRSPEPLDAAEASLPEPHYFPGALSRMYGYLPSLPDKYLRQYIKPTQEESKERSQRRDGKRSRGSVMPKKVVLFPNNVTFKKSDWVNEPIPSDKRGYDCILALSVVKWIHLNNGDDGLMEFFTRVFTTLHPNGRFILEAQPWESYHKATRLSSELKESFGQLKLRPEDFERILLEEIGFTSVEKLIDESGKGFKRPLHVYRRAAGSWL